MIIRVGFIPVVVFGGIAIGIAYIAQTVPGPVTQVINFNKEWKKLVRRYPSCSRNYIMCIINLLIYTFAFGKTKRIQEHQTIQVDDSTPNNTIKDKIYDQNRMT